ncbi:MAG: hypothetical protein ACXAC7_02575 [Candidatus Hodarchaeales archaeon]|jgi:hypothetical protein
MIVYAIYIIREDGITILSENFQSIDTLPDELLMGGLFTAIQSVASEMTDGFSEMKSVEIEGLSYHIRSFGFYRIVMVTDAPKAPEDIIQTVGLRFMKEFGEVLVEGTSEVETYNPFKKTILEIVNSQSITDDSKSLKPSKVLHTGEIFSLPHHLHSTALAMITIKEGTIKDIAKESGNSLKVTRKYITSLQEMGFIGKKSTKGKKIFFCSL